MAFVCFDVSVEGSPRAVPLEECRPVALAVNNTGAQTLPDGRALHVLVTQTTRGEVAAVDLTRRVVLDSDRRIPGATFVPVGEVPTDVVIPENAPTCAWVASSADRSIVAIPTVRFRPEHDRSVPDFISRIDLPGRPSELMLSPDERTLFVAVPEVGAVGRIAIDPVTCNAGAVDLIEVSDVVPAAVLADPTTRTCAGRDLCRICPADFDVASAAQVEPRRYAPASPLPRPRVLELDRRANVLLVGDENLPVIHRIDVGTGTPLTSLAVGAPIRDLALTPFVPDSYALPADLPAPPTSRYLYAIDDLDGTVMVIEYGDQGSVTFGAVLPVTSDASARADRIAVNVPARGLSVMTPGFEVASPDPRVATMSSEDVYHGLCNYRNEPASPVPAPGILRGVFVGLAMTDGTLRIVDVYDLDAPCRGRSVGPAAPPADCVEPAVSSDVNVYVRRHRPRVGLFPARFVGVFDGPSITNATGANLRIDDAGSAGQPPFLLPVTCAPGQGVVFPVSEATTRICTQRDPFAAGLETWRVSWQGPIQSTASTGGNFRREGDTVFLEARTDFCARGVLSAAAAAAIPATEPEAGYAGDLLAITTAVDGMRLEMDATCRAVVGISAVGQAAQPILVPIAEAFSNPTDLRSPYVGRLVLRADAPIIDASTGEVREGVTLADALACLTDELIAFDVRVQDGYAVSGTRSGFLHRVIETVDGCRLDPTLPRDLAGRAFNEVPFFNRRISLLPSLSGASAPRVGTELVFRIGVNTASTGDVGLRVDLGVSGGGGRLLTLPTELSWNDRTQHLYVIETERRGLLEVETPEFRVIAGNRFE